LADDGLDGLGVVRKPFGLALVLKDAAADVRVKADQVIDGWVPGVPLEWGIGGRQNGS
jgi:hypothetical protein